MKEEYDFSKGERGKFYTKNATFNLPIYLEAESESIKEAIPSTVADMLEADLKVSFTQKEEYDLSTMKSRPNPYAKQLKKQVTVSDM